MEREGGRAEYVRQDTALIDDRRYGLPEQGAREDGHPH